MSRYVINGRFLTRNITGVERFAYEMSLQLDSLMLDDEIILAVPNEDIEPIELKNIKIVKVGRLHGNAWEQIDLPFFIKKEHALGLHLCNTAPLIKPDIVCIHDVNIRVNPESYSKQFVAWYRIQYMFSTAFAKRVLTISEFSESEICRYYPKAKKKCRIVSSAGWEHMPRIAEDTKIFEKYPSIRQGEYYFALSSSAPHKNFEWIIGAAKANKASTFVIAGKVKDKVFRELDMEALDNVIVTGYISDGEMKALMGHAKAFVSPSLYEGLGLPPLEALSVGTPIIISDIAVYHEVYGDAAIYVDPHNSNINLDSVLIDDDEIKCKRKAILERYSYGKSVQKLLEALPKD